MIRPFASRLLWPLLTSACSAPPRFLVRCLLLSERSMQISPGTTRFFPSICLPLLSRMIPCSYWASACMAVLPSCVTSYVISIRQARGLPVVSLFPHPASFRSHLTVDTLAFGCILPATGRIRDFHPLETCAARRTIKTGAAVVVAPVLFVCREFPEQNLTLIIIYE